MVPKLSTQLPGVIIGGGVFNTQMNKDPLALPIVEIISKAFSLGINAIDTSPYYGPSEELLGKALQHPEITNNYNREDYIIMTKAGRIKLDEFDYSSDWIRKSVARSLQRFETSYLDLVYCHDIEFVSDEEMLEAVGTLFDLQKDGIVRNVGISAYPPQVLSDALPKIRAKYNRVPDVIQSYAHFTLQNTVLDSHLDDWMTQGVDCVINSSPLNMGLLSGHPAAEFHPAPQGLRNAALEAAEYCESHGWSLPDLALKFVIGKYNAIASRNGGGFIINGISFIEELDKLVEVYKEMMVSEPGCKAVGNCRKVDMTKLQEYQPAFDSVRAVFGDWLDYSWKSP